VPTNPLGILLLLALALAASRPAWGFEVADIRVEGLQRIAVGTVFNYLPVQVGDDFEPAEAPQLIHTLYKTGFFKDVRVGRDGDVLVVEVRERPAIGKVEIEGNKDIETKPLTKALEDIGLKKGEVFKRSTLDRVQQELRRQYYARGKYGVRVETRVTPLERNRVAVKILIKEGVAARIRRIDIIGNRAFDDDELLDHFKLGPSNWLSDFTKNDRYSKQQLAGDLETLRSWYLDRGYINFEIQSAQVSITPDKKDIYITIVIREGKVYRIKDIKLAGKLPVPAKELFPAIHLRRGELFSRKAVTGSAERISKRLGEHGYAFANVNAIPDIDNEKREVALTFFVDPGKRVYVRRINIHGNSKTRDEVLRRELRQMEAAWFSTDLVRRSRERLQRLGYFEEVNIETPAVAGSADEVDVDIKVKEKRSGSIAAGLGYSQSQGLVFNTSVSQNNFLGTGKRVSLAFNNSRANTIYRLAYTNPYYTIDGISRGFDLSYRKTDFANLSSADYLTNVGRAAVNFGVPISDTGSVGLSLGYEHTDFEAGTSPLAQEFERAHGNRFDDLRLRLFWRDDTRDSAIFPHRGALQNAIAKISVPYSDLEFYRLSYQHRRYLPIWHDYVLYLNGFVGYGDGLGDTDLLPFFENFFAGGPRSVRGFKENTLGPREPTTRAAIGGNLKLTGGAELYMPPFFGGQFKKTVRLGLFFDIGNTWLTYGDHSRPSVSFDAGEFRYSVGVSAVWLSPIGALKVSFAQPLNKQPGDEIENFQFTLGNVF